MPTIREFETTGEAYDACQCDETIKDGDVLLIAAEGVVGVADTWPVAVTAKHGNLHRLKDGNFASYNGGRLLEGAALASAVAIEHGFALQLGRVAL